MGRPTPRPVSVSRRIEAPAHIIFELLIDPTTHPNFDALRDGGSNALVAGVGDAFITKMHLPDLGDYEMRNNVVEYELNKRIGWEPTPEIFDCAEASEYVREAVNDGEGWIQTISESLERLDQLCAQLHD